jgi:hypothetical protein
MRNSNGFPLTGPDGATIVPPCVGRPAEVAAAVEAYTMVGVRTMIWHFIAPFDIETIERLAEVRGLVS